jgi:hypothetical protein
MNKEFKFGLIKGRHDMPVDAYLLDEVKNVLDFKEIRHKLRKKLNEVPFEFEASIREAPCSLEGDITCRVSKDILKVYVTGLTAAVAELISVCTEEGIPLTLMHYDREKESYVSQYVTTWWW